MLQIRNSIFETNSSSTHAFTTLKELKIYWFYTKDIEIPKTEMDTDNNLIISYSNIQSDSCIKTFIGINQKVLYILFLLLNYIDYYNNYLEDNDQNKIWLEELTIKEIENLKIIKPLFETIKKIGFDGINIKRDESKLDEIEKLIPFTIKEFLYNLFNNIDGDCYIKDIKDLEEIIGKNLEEIITNDEIVLIEAERFCVKNKKLIISED
jgi:hypothetical protein